MFEKEAEKYLKKLLKRLKIKEEDLVENQPKFISWEKMNFISLNVSNVSKAFQDGAEFGYNKANEWHYVKDELPELYKDVLVVFPRGDCDVKRLTNHNEWVGRGSWCFLTDVIAWKEIVLPELKESK